MPAASNTRECFSEFIGQKVVGVLFDALPVNRADLKAGNKTLVFEDGRGLTISSTGAFWIEREEEIDRAIKLKKRDLKRTQREIAGVLDLAGAR